MISINLLTPEVRSLVTRTGPRVKACEHSNGGPRCDVCACSAGREQRTAWKKANPEKVRARKRRWYQANLEKARAQSREQQKRRKLRAHDAMLAAGRKRQGVIDAHLAPAVLALQGGECAICHDNRPGGHGTWCADHDHTTGLLRGMLCNDCNVGIGRLKDSIVCLQSAIAYLEAPPADVVRGRAVVA